MPVSTCNLICILNTYIIMLSSWVIASNNAYLSKQQTPLINQSNKIKKYVLHIRTHHLLILEFLENMSLVPVPQRRRTFLQRHPWIHNYKVYFKVKSLWMLLFEQSHWSSTYKNRTTISEDTDLSKSHWINKLLRYF